jgi:hypothetical protein
MDLAKKSFGYSGSETTTTDATREGLQQHGGWDPYAQPQQGATANQPAAQERINVERYKERLERQSIQQAPVLSFAADGKSNLGRGAGGEGSGQRGPAVARQVPGRTTTPPPSVAQLAGERNDVPIAFEAAARPSESPATLDEGDVASGQSAAPPTAAGLASLDFNLPAHGELYRFTIPRGEATITAQAFSSDLLRRLIVLAIVVVVAIAAWLVVRRVRMAHFAWLATRSGSTLLVCLGLLGLITGLLPWAGLAAILIGGILKVHRWCGDAEAKRPA